MRSRPSIALVSCDARVGGSLSRRLNRQSPNCTRFGTIFLSVTRAISVEQSLYWHDCWSALVLDQDHQEFRRLGIARVPVNDMNIVGAFIEGLSWCQCYLLSTLQLHHNGALQHVNKGMCIVSVDRTRPAGRMLDCDHQSFPAGTLRQIFRHERCNLRLLSHRRAAHEA